MEVDTIGEEISGAIIISNSSTSNNLTGDEKRTKWQLPPSHQNLLSSPQRKSKGLSRISDASFSSSNSDNKDMTKKVLNTDEEMTQERADYSLEDISNSLSVPKINRLNSVARAEVCPKKHRARLMSTKGMAARIRDHYGYEISNTTFLYAEEALYLLEIGKLEIYLGRVSLSVERARTLFLHTSSHADNHSKVRSCFIDEYLVYKHLSQLGYRLRRRHQNDVTINHSPSSSNPLHELCIDAQAGGINITACDTNESCEMDLDEELEMPIDIQDQQKILTSTISSSSSGVDAIVDCNRGIKRKFIEVCNSQSPGSSTHSSSAKDISDDEDADEELECTSGVGDINMDSANENSTCFHTSSYTVTEADSDVEIIDESEFAGTGVHIEEIGIGYDGDIEDDSTVGLEPQPSTSAVCFASHGLVDLADSDAEDEDWTSFSKVFSKFVPNATIQIGFPPSSLLPSNIRTRESIFEFELHSRESNRSDSDLEYYVDELNLNSSPGDSEIDKKKKQSVCSYRSWEEWRRGTLNEAKAVLNESLLAHSCIYPGEDPLKKLHLWGEKKPVTKRKAEEGWRSLNMPYELYHPSAGYNKHKLKDDMNPNYIVAVVRSDELIPSFASCDSSINGVPVLVALVSDDSSILFMNPDRSPIPSLY